MMSLMMTCATLFAAVVSGMESKSQAGAAFETYDHPQPATLYRPVDLPRYYPLNVVADKHQLTEEMAAAKENEAAKVEWRYRGRGYGKGYGRGYGYGKGYGYGGYGKRYGRYGRGYKYRGYGKGYGYY